MEPMTYSVGDVARIVDVSVRTLHHYDEIGLLRPMERTKAGYRRYGEAEVRRLHQILAYREFGFDLARIATILDDPSVDAEEHLHLQRSLLKERVGRLEHMLGGVEIMMSKAEGESDAEAGHASNVERPRKGEWRGAAVVMAGLGLAGAATPRVLHVIERSPLGVQPLFAHLALFSLVGLVCAGTVFAYSLRGSRGHLFFQTGNALIWTALVAVSYRGVSEEYGFVGAFVGLGAAAWGSLIVALQTRRADGGSVRVDCPADLVILRGTAPSDDRQLRVGQVEPLSAC
jgi:DNA-binding transcriptional MerR regulator